LAIPETVAVEPLINMVLPSTFNSTKQLTCGPGEGDDGIHTTQNGSLPSRRGRLQILPPETGAVEFF